MYKLVKTKSKTKPVGIIAIGKNGETLNYHSVKTKQAAFKNIIAVLSGMDSQSEIRVFVQDETSKPGNKFIVINDGTVLKN